MHVVNGKPCSLHSTRNDVPALVTADCDQSKDWKLLFLIEILCSALVLFLRIISNVAMVTGNVTADVIADIQKK